MFALRRCRRGRLALTGSAAVLLAVSTGLTAAAGEQRAAPLRHADPLPRADPLRPADPLQREVDAVHASGAVGAMAEVTSPGAHGTARAGTAVSGTGKPMPQNGRFRIGSATKTFTATVVLQLVGEGRMSLEDTVERWLPGVVRGNGNDGSQVTVRQLLQHTSGIPDVLPEIAALHSAAGYRAERFRTYTPEELVGLAMRDSRKFPPGRDWSYSNTNYVLAAMIIREVTGHSWAHELNDRIIRPLGLRGTSTPGLFPFIPGPHARSYASYGTGTGTGAGTDVTVLNPSMGVGSGSVISTAHDLNRFYAALLGGRLLPPAQLDEMTTTVDAPELGVRYGLGLGELPLPCGGSYFGHPGELLGYHTWSGVTRDGTRTAVVYATSDGGPHTQRAMSTLVEKELCRTGS
ncbi:serine hydrolase domain-containing protein [Streptomyces sp. NPDC049967]|uniref:serine hydrolase domain-containing protein n=1 Tax=unclassified Streptomyces TaxID=2593676 RepID=UPI002E0DEFA4|nr:MULTISPECIES: serine hydrolase domain-containing protein [unclassified Streptomyces]WSJ24098.1 beta-lactamase family protein [Streptomyces sp. NBC_01324]